MFRLLRSPLRGADADDLVPSAEEVARITAMLARTETGGVYEGVLARRVGQLHARAGSSVYDALAGIDAAFVEAGRPVGTTQMTGVAVDAWAQDVLALAGDDCREALTGLVSAEQLQAHVAPCRDDVTRHVLIAEVMSDADGLAPTGALQRLEVELSLGLVHAVLDRAVPACTPWARLGACRLGAAVRPDGGVGAAVSDARRWLRRWRNDLDVTAWTEPVPVEPRERGLLLRDLAM